MIITIPTGARNKVKEILSARIRNKKDWVYYFIDYDGSIAQYSLPFMHYIVIVDGPNWMIEELESKRKI